MDIKINDTVCPIPSDLTQFTVGQFLSYYDRYGRELDTELAEILEREYEDEFERDLDLSAHTEREALAWFSHFSGFDLTRLKGEDALPVLTAFHTIKSLLIESENEEAAYPFVVEWNDQVWEIGSYKVTPDSPLTFIELLASKETIRQLRKLGKGRWDALPYLCAIFFRKQGEAFSESFIGEDSERLQLMQELPMAFGIKVAFFLSVSISIWKQTLRYSKEVAEATNT